MDRARLLVLVVAGGCWLGTGCQQATPPVDAPKVAGGAVPGAAPGAAPGVAPGGVPDPVPGAATSAAPAAAPAPADATGVTPAPGSPPPSLPAVALPSTDPPPGTLYYCDVGGQRAPIELEARMDALCRRHPQMGPCRYERDACRARGGRVYTARDEEVTPQVEAEYDRLVRRVRFQADGGGSGR